MLLPKFSTFATSTSLLGLVLRKSATQSPCTLVERIIHNASLHSLCAGEYSRQLLVAYVDMLTCVTRPVLLCFSLNDKGHDRCY